MSLSSSPLSALDLHSRLGPRAVTARMLRRSLLFLPTLLAISSSNARAMPTSPPARHAGRQPSQLTLSVRLCDYADCRKPQAPQVCKGVAYCSKDCQVCVASHPACALSRPQERLQGLRGHKHLRASPHQELLQGLRGRLNLRA